MDAPPVRVKRDWRGRWGVQVKWPRSGPWARLLLFPRFVWHGPFGDASRRWTHEENALVFAELVRDLMARKAIAPTHWMPLPAPSKEQ